MELQNYYSPNIIWSKAYEVFTKKWKENLSKTSNEIERENGWNAFLSGKKDNPVASIGLGAFISDGKDQPKKIKDNWSDISQRIKQNYKEDDLGKKLQDIKDIKNLIIEIVAERRNLAVNRMLITFFPDLFINIPNEDDVDIFVNLLESFGFEEDGLDWIEKSSRIKSFIYEKVKRTDGEKYINCWTIYDKLRKMDILKDNNLILTGAPGTGKTFLARELAAYLIGCSEKALKEKKDQFCFVQFHPSYDYTDFIEGLRPDVEKDNSEIKFKRVDGVFKTLCKNAIGQPDKNHVIVIDEINRGEVSKIFGELFFSIDPSYRKKEVRIPVKTQYQNLVPENDFFKDGFYVPENVYVIGTMNDIDRSVESMDFAFRRRFAFKEITADESQQMLTGKNREEAIKKMDAINKIIEDPQNGLGRQYQIGASYFKKALDKKGGECKMNRSDWESLWDNHIKGVLYEYLRGRPDGNDLMRKMENAYYKNDKKDVEGNTGEPKGQSDNSAEE